MDTSRTQAASETFAALADLEARVLAAATAAGLRPVPVPLHLAVRCNDGDDAITEVPVADIEELLAGGWTPVLHGTLVRNPHTGWAVLGADRLMAELAAVLEPRLALFASDVDGVHATDPKEDPTAPVIPELNAAAMPKASRGRGWDVTGRMAGKMQHAFTVASYCPTLIVNGLVRGRVADALRGKPVIGTRIKA